LGHPGRFNAAARSLDTEAAVVDDVMGVLGRHAVDDATKKEVLSILQGLKGEIVGL
jgi:hypothetical protein